MNKREFQKLLTLAIKEASGEVSRARGDGSKYASALSMEGYQGGYLNALYDVDAMLAHGYPSDDRGVWKRALAALKLKSNPPT